MDKYASTSSDYCSKINKVVVNDKEYPVYDEEGKDNYYSMTYSDGLCIYMGSIKDGENTIIVSDVYKRQDMFDMSTIIFRVHMIESFLYYS